jgi:hypothetical protein
VTRSSITLAPAQEPSRAPLDAPPPAPETPGPLGAWTRFWFAGTDPFGLHALRLLMGLVLLAWLLPLAGNVGPFFGLDGWFDRQAYVEAARLPGGPPRSISWSLLYLCGSNPAALRFAYWAAVAVVALFTLGVATRLTGVLTWLAVASFTANPAFDSDADTLLQMIALYLALGYLLLGLRNGRLSWAERILGPFDALLVGGLLRKPDEPARESLAANVATRLIQAHLAILLVATGLHKLQFGEWWAGMAHWYVLHPPLETTIAQARRLPMDAPTYLALLNLAAYGSLAWQIGFPLFAWRTGWARLVLLGGAALGWAGLTWFFQMPLFGPALAIGCLAFLTAGEWAVVDRLWQRVRRIKVSVAAPRPGLALATQER